jgi:hypothetical protein
MRGTPPRDASCSQVRQDALAQAQLSRKTCQTSVPYLSRVP